MIRSDIHVHTSFSSDCDEAMENQIEQALKLGLETLCFTEHMDKDYPPAPLRKLPEEPEFMLDTDSYQSRYLELKEKICRQDKASVRSRARTPAASVRVVRRLRGPI